MTYDGTDLPPVDQEGRVSVPDATTWMRKHLVRWLSYPKPRHTIDNAQGDDARASLFARWLDNVP